jgi:2-polyprenyl-3-methyl-5-hydroxy-6-metoxy-1,4-benzoquinol methylase
MTHTSNLMPEQQITPERFFNAINSYQLTEAIKSAIELDVFTAVGEGNMTSAAIAQRCHASERGIRILCDFLTIHGFLTKQEAIYRLTADSAEFGDRRSPAYLGSAIEFLLTPRLRECHTHLTEAVRRGGTSLGEGMLDPENPDWVKYARGMVAMARRPAEIIAAELSKQCESRRVLDIAASHGMFGIAIAKQNPTAQIYANDWKNVLQVAQDNAVAAGIGDRYHLIPGSAFEADFGTGYDLALITNLLHGFDAPTCTKLMQKVQVALNPGGRAAIAEYVPNPDRVSPPIAAAFSLTMLAATPSGDAYTFAELESISKTAGFARVELSPSLLGRNRLLIAYR